MDYTVPEFTFLRPIFIAFLIILAILLFVVIFQRKNILVNRFSFFSILLICLTMSSITLGSAGYIVDAYGLGGDVISSYMWTGIVVLSVLNTTVFLIKNNRIRS